MTSKKLSVKFRDDDFDWSCGEYVLHKALLGGGGHLECVSRSYIV